MDIIIPLILIWHGQTYACVPVTEDLVMRCWEVKIATEVAL